MILLSQDAVEDLERLRAFLDHANPEAAKRVSALIWATVEKLRDFPALGIPTIPKFGRS